MTSQSFGIPIDHSLLTWREPVRRLASISHLITK